LEKISDFRSCIKSGFKRGSRPGFLKRLTERDQIIGGTRDLTRRPDTTEGKKCCSNVLFQKGRCQREKKSIEKEGNFASPLGDLKVDGVLRALSSLAQEKGRSGGKGIFREGQEKEMNPGFFCEI